MARATTMNFKEAVAIATSSLWAHKLRSMLTLIGVVIGVAAVIAVVSLINGANQYVATRVFRLGADVFGVADGREPGVGEPRGLVARRAEVFEPRGATGGDQFSVDGRSAGEAGVSVGGADRGRQGADEAARGTVGRRGGEESAESVGEIASGREELTGFRVQGSGVRSGEC